MINKFNVYNNIIGVFNETGTEAVLFLTLGLRGNMFY